MRADDTYFQKKQQATQHGTFKLAKNEGKENINDTK